ncbi:MAG: glycosyltransferase [Bacteroidales bacterium]|nr:glycosyltransferase [Bacteroidales bacterium]MCC8152758.1 glycosyltransferase [Tannerellaceae bacterium]
MRKICFLQYDLAGGGAERKVCTLANYFVSRGYEVEIGLFGKDNVQYDLDPRVSLTFICRDTYEYHSKMEKFAYVVQVTIQKIFAYFPAIFIEKIFGIVAPSVKNTISGDRVKKHYKKKNDYIDPIRAYVINRLEDRVFVTMMVQPYLEIVHQMEDIINKGKFKAPYIVMECNNPIPGMDVTKELAAKRDIWYPWATKCVSMTNDCVECFSDEIQRKSVVIPNPIRDDLPEPYCGKIRRSVVVTYCRLSRQKNLPLLIRAFARFHSIHSEYTLEIYGIGELKEELYKLISALNLEKCASIYPFDPHIHEKIIDCAMFISSSDWEGFCNSVLEALAIGLPVIATDCKFGTRDMVQDHVNGILVPVGDENAMVAAMMEIASNSE